LAEAYDVVIIGAGNAAHAAALAAEEQGASAVILEKASKELRGGNTRFTGGVFRTMYDGAKDVAEIVPEIVEQGLEDVDVGRYSYKDYWDDIMRVSEGQGDEKLIDLLIRQSTPTIKWMKSHGVKYELDRLRHAEGHDAVHEREAMRKAGIVPIGRMMRASGEGPNLSKSLFQIAEEHELPVEYDTMLVDLAFSENGAVEGVKVRGADDLVRTIKAGSVILACGGFQASPEMRTRYLGPEWDACRVRGTRMNTGDGHRIAINHGARAYGQWSGCHATPIDATAGAYGNFAVWDKTNRLSYPFGIMVDREGVRFVDEGEDFATFTYAKYGRAILGRPGAVAYQIFDAQSEGMLEPRYSTGEPVVANTIEELAHKLTMDAETLSHTVAQFNAAVTEVEFIRQKKDGKGTKGLYPPKTNWARKIEVAPFKCYPVACGITFTFGGVQINEQAQVLDGRERVIPNLYAVGEITGGFFYNNYPAGAGLMRGAVTGKIAGEHAATEGRRV
jgi:tricarballylate dehydrogenase